MSKSLTITVALDPDSTPLVGKTSNCEITGQPTADELEALLATLCGAASNIACRGLGPEQATQFFKAMHALSQEAAWEASTKLIPAENNQEGN